MALKKASRRLVISDEALNSYGFRTLTSGIDISQYKRNPIMLWMHTRAWRGTKEEVLPIGIVTDLKFEGDTLTGQPEFDDTDEFAMRLFDKFESGVLNMCSPGLKPITWDDSEELKVSGQTYPTLSKSVLREISIADIGANDNALAFSDVALYDEKDQLVELSANSIQTFFKTQTPPEMKIEELKLNEIAALVGLTDKSTPQEFAEAVKKLITDKETAERNLAALVDQNKKDSIQNLVSGALAAKKITADQVPHFTKLAEGDFETAKSLIDSMPGYTPISTQLSEKTENSEVEELKKLSAERLWQEGKLERLMELDIDAFKLKYKELNKTDFKG